MFKSVSLIFSVTLLVKIQSILSLGSYIDWIQIMQERNLEKGKGKNIKLTTKRETNERAFKVWQLFNFICSKKKKKIRVAIPSDLWSISIC